MSEQLTVLDLGTLIYRRPVPVGNSPPMTHVMLEGRDPAADPETAHEKVRAARRALQDLRNT